VLWEYGQVDGSDWAINDVTIAIERMRVMYVMLFGTVFSILICGFKLKGFRFLGRSVETTSFGDVFSNTDMQSTNQRNIAERLGAIT